jgi:hypothetical protein
MILPDWLYPLVLVSVISPLFVVIPATDKPFDVIVILPISVEILSDIMLLPFDVTVISAFCTSIALDTTKFEVELFAILTFPLFSIFPEIFASLFPA